MIAPHDFFAGHTGRVTLGRDSFDLTVTELGELHVPSGRLGASDPFVALGEALEIAIPPGTYPASVTVADVSATLDGSHLREAYLSLNIAPGVVARVESVVPFGKEPPADPDAYVGVSVDAGTVAFADVEAVTRCMPDDSTWYDDLFDPDEGGGWFGAIDDPGHLVAGAANIELPMAVAGENVVLCHSGWGDGFYPVLCTHDAGGALLGVHIDLQVVVGGDEDQDDPGEPDPSATRPLTTVPPASVEPEPRKGLFSRLFGG